MASMNKPTPLPINKNYHPHALELLKQKEFVEYIKEIIRQETPPTPPPTQPTTTKENDGSITISREEFNQFYDDYHFFLTQKNTLTNQIKAFSKEAQHQIQRIKCSRLDEFFSRHRDEKRPVFLCDVCKVFTVGTTKGLATHRRKCLKERTETKLPTKEEEEGEEEEEEED